MDYVIYGFDDCPWCQKAKALLTAEGKNFEFIAINDKDARTRWMDDHGFTGTDRTFPRVYEVIALEDGHGYRLIGGYTELEKHLLEKVA